MSHYPKTLMLFLAGEGDVNPKLLFGSKKIALSIKLFSSYFPVNVELVESFGKVLFITTVKEDDDNGFFGCIFYLVGFSTIKANMPFVQRRAKNRAAPRPF